MKGKYRFKMPGFLLMVILILADRISKYLASSILKDNDPFVIIKGVFELQYLENRGAAFGVLEGKQVFFIVLTVLIAFFCIWFFIRLPHEMHFYFMELIIILLLSGAFGNFIDRVFNGYVVDFFYFSLIDFPIFNVADIYVTMAEAGLIIAVFFVYKGEDFKDIFTHSSKL